MSEDPSRGRPGEPGKDAEGPVGGAGGQGGTGGQGQQTGGTGGVGGTGGAALGRSRGDIQRSLNWLIAATVVLFLALASLSIAGYFANRNRIADVQESRLESCRASYEGVRQLLRPFFPHHPDAAERAALNRFNRRVEFFKAACPSQTDHGRIP